MKCNNCHTEKEELEYKDDNGNPLCEDCYHELYAVCHSCDSVFNIDDITEIDNEIYCESCTDAHFTYIYCCDEYIDNDHVYTSQAGTPYCETHYYDEYGHCDRCNNEYELDDLSVNELTGRQLCSNCIEENIIHAYDYKPVPIFKKLIYENTLFMGIELEVENKGDLKSHAKDFSNYLSSIDLDDRFYLKHDSSICDVEGNTTGFEIVSHPATMKYWHESKAWSNILKYLSKHKFTSYVTGKCGLHVHVNKSIMTKREMLKLQTFFSYNQGWLKILAVRESNFAHFEYIPLKSAIKYANPIITSRRVAVNFLNPSTIEFRLFRGTLDHKRFNASLQFVDACCYFIKQANWLTVGKFCFNEFMDYLKITNRYPHLERFLSNLDKKFDFNKMSKMIEQ